MVGNTQYCLTDLSVSTAMISLCLFQESKNIIFTCGDFKNHSWSSPLVIFSVPTRENNGPCHISGNFLPFKGKSPFLSSQAAPFFSFAKGKKSLLQRNPAHMTRAIVFLLSFHCTVILHCMVEKAPIQVGNAHYCLVSLMWMKIGSNDITAQVPGVS
jgi:hypothetical protein